MKTIKQDGHSKLVEFEEGGQTRRAILPVGEEDLEMSIPHGFPFAEAIKDKVCEGMAQRIEAELHRRNLWTLEDVMKNPGTAQGAVLAAYGVDYAILIQLSKQFQGGLNDGR